MTNELDRRAVSTVLAGMDPLMQRVEAVYKDVHAHPELSMQESRTAAIAAEALQKAGYQVTRGVGRTGVVGVLRNGDGPTLMLRADMDALPIAETTGLPYASKVTASDAQGRTVPVATHVRPRHARRVADRRVHAAGAGARRVEGNADDRVPAGRGDG